MVNGFKCDGRDSNSMNRILLSNFNTIRLLSCGKVVSPVVSVRQSVILSTGGGLSSSLRLCPLWGSILPHPGQRTLLYTEYPLPRHVQFCSLWSTYMLAGERFVSYWIAFSLIDKSTLILIFQWGSKRRHPDYQDLSPFFGLEQPWPWKCTEMNEWSQ